MSEANFTPGPWQWCQYSDGRTYLATPDRGHLTVMDFVRFGMGYALPRFAIWKGEERERMGGIMHRADKIEIAKHPDAHLIAAAPLLYRSLCEVLALARIKFGNRHPDVNQVFAQADAAIAAVKGG